MARIDWSQVGSRVFETGVDRGVLYVGNNPGVPWVGLVSVKQKTSGGDTKPRYLDGVKISNYTTIEEFEGDIEAYTYPREFEQCDGTANLQNGLRARNQGRKPFGMTYRTLVGDEIQGTTLGYKIHVLYNLRAEPSERPYESLTNDSDALTFNWNLTSRGVFVDGLYPTAHFEVDSRDVPAELLAQLEDILYGTVDSSPSLPSAGELVFMFDEYNDLVYDAGDVYTPVFEILDAGTSTTPITETIDAGGL